MTNLTKEVRRLTHTMHRGRQVIVALRPPDMLTFRLKGTRHVYAVSILGAFNWAMKVEAMALLKKHAEERKARRAARGGR